MFTEKKFRSLDPRLQYRKAALILKDAEKQLKEGKEIDVQYLRMILNAAAISGGQRFQEEIEDLAVRLDGPEALWAADSLKYKILDKAGIQYADWDMLDTDAAGDSRRLLPISVYLENLRSPFNVGSIFRTAESFCFSEVLLSPATPTPEQPRAKRSAMGTEEKISWRQAELSELKEAAHRGQSIFALETDGTPIEEFKFPENGIMILGSEETGVSPETLEIARSSGGVVSIPLFGVKKSINVGVAFGIAAYCWSAYILRNTRTEL